MNGFRKLRADEIQVNKYRYPSGYRLMLYKTAQVDMAILDETYGKFGWEREYDGEFCKVTIRDPDTGREVTKEDVGYCDAEDPEMRIKGKASDAFKRACMSWGIGRELYTAPFMWVDASTLQSFSSDTTRFSVADIGYDGDRIAYVTIRCKDGNETFLKTFGKAPAASAEENTTAVQKPEPAKPHKVTINTSFKDDTVILIESLKGKAYADVKKTKAFLELVLWAADRDVTYATPEENEQFAELKRIGKQVESLKNNA